MSERVRPGDLAVLTGATGDIGRALAHRLDQLGYRLVLLGRDQARLEELGGELASRESSVLAFSLDRDEELEDAVERLAQLPGRLGALVHSAGLLETGSIEELGADSLDRQYRINLRAPYVLTRALAPRLREAAGQIVFVNSSAGAAPGRAGIGPYAATKHGLRALADSVRAELNPSGVRVVSVYPGRTAGSMQREIHRAQGAAYDPAKLMSPDDVAETVAAALGMPASAELTDLHVRPMSPP